MPQCRAFRKIYSACNRLFRRSFFISARAPSSFCHNKNPRVSTRGISFSGGSPQYCRQRASRAYHNPAVMRLLFAARKRAFPVLIFLCLWLRSPPSIVAPYFCFSVYFSVILAFSSFLPSLLLFFCSSAKPFLSPRTIRGFFLYKKIPPQNAEGADLLLKFHLYCLRSSRFCFNSSLCAFSASAAALSFGLINSRTTMPIRHRTPTPRNTTERMLSCNQ